MIVRNDAPQMVEKAPTSSEDARFCERKCGIDVVAMPSRVVLADTATTVCEAIVCTWK